MEPSRFGMLLMVHTSLSLKIIQLLFALFASVQMDQSLYQDLMTRPSSSGMLLMVHASLRLKVIFNLLNQSASTQMVHALHQDLTTIPSSSGILHWCRLSATFLNARSRWN